MNVALEEAAKALERGEVPIGAVIVENSGNIVARAGNETRARLDPSAHAEQVLFSNFVRRPHVSVQTSIGMLRTLFNGDNREFSPNGR